jgi:hypothetical protein
MPSAVPSVSRWVVQLGHYANDGAIYYRKYSIADGSVSNWVSIGGTTQHVWYSVIADKMYVFAMYAGGGTYLKIMNLADDSVIQDWTGLANNAQVKIDMFSRVDAFGAQPQSGVIWADTSGAEVALKVRNKANSAWIIFPQTAGAPSSTNSYQGDGSANRAIAHGLGSTPKMVLIYDNTTPMQFYIFYSNNGTIAFWDLLGATKSGTFSVSNMDSTNFYVGNVLSYPHSANQASTMYYWVAIG